ncbi:CubicO group peptidase (beta-lactamase class C family) [Streptomyces aurantiacus]|uniref:serine hydrolase domain-containing protein n=1 Tax=Streptomyces aurantiacus TaxID=47760 RepID=UPI0027920D1A|nr:serine hydrolase domain-containing protein [Streptomyces aurantiacus]MDQ0772377.1 CubicO group peptidase (beta-lactamase class C family) [Streptomyces aurantiacus]
MSRTPQASRPAPWPGDPFGVTGQLPPRRPPKHLSGHPSAQAHPDGETVRELLDDAVGAVDAPDVVLALSRDGHRTVRCGGTGPPPPVPRDRLRYEIGSASKTFTALLLAQLTQSGVLSAGEPAAACLDPARPAGRLPVTLAHLITHTSGLPALPAGFFLRALPTWRTDPYARYPDQRVVDAFLRRRGHRRPGTRWHYSNFGVAVLGHALAAATATPWDDLLTGQVLRPLGLDGTALRPGGPGIDAIGHRKDGSTPTSPLNVGGFQAAGAVRATPHDLLTFLEAHLDPSGRPLAGALRAVRRPVLRRGWGHRHVHTVGWFQHPTGHGPMYFHCGATLGQQAFLGFRPDTGTALAAVCTRRFRARDTFVATAYALLAEA